MANAKNILVGAARVYTSYGTNASRPDLTAAGVFPWSVNTKNNSAITASAASVSTPAYLGTTAAAYWRDLGFTSNGVEISYEPGYSDVTVDQLLDAARLFQHSLKVNLKTEVNEATFENINMIWGQADAVLNAGSAFDTVPTLSTNVASTTPAVGDVTQVNILGGALGVAPQERTLVLVGQAPGSFGLAASAVSNSGSASAGVIADASSIRSKERVYVARRAVQEQTTAHSLKRDAVTVFPVTFRCLPDADRNAAAGSEYGFVVDRVYGTY